MAFRITGITIMLAFYGCYFAKMALQRQKGIKTDQLGKGKAGHVRAIELTVKAASIIIAAAEVLSIILDVTRLPVWARLLGALTGTAGVVIFIISVSTMRDNWRAGVSKTDKTELVNSGIYRISRNPAFLGFYLVYAGILLMFFNLPLLILSLFAVVMFHLQVVKVEEPFLLSVFGEQYAVYQRQVNRYLGKKRV